MACSDKKIFNSKTHGGYNSTDDEHSDCEKSSCVDDVDNCSVDESDDCVMCVYKKLGCYVVEVGSIVDLLAQEIETNYEFETPTTSYAYNTTFLHEKLLARKELLTTKYQNLLINVLLFGQVCAAGCCVEN